MSFRSVLLVLLFLLYTTLEPEQLFAFAQNATTSNLADAPDSWWTPDRARFICLGLLLGIGACLMWVSVLRRRMQAYIEVYHEQSEKINQLEEQVEDTRNAKSYLYTSISNEIKSPLDDIQNFSMLLNETLYEEKQLTYVNTIRSSSSSLRALVNDLRDFSQIEAGKLKLDTHPFVLQQCLKEAINVVLPRASEKELELSYSIESGVPRGIVLDSIRLKQILVSLLNNGIKFTERGSVSIQAHSNQASNGFELTLAVKDTGIGIPAEKLKTITASLSASGNSIAQLEEGIGLGLALCQRLTSLMGGRIWVESTAGEGSTFFISLPAKEAQIEEETVSAPPTPASTHIGFVDPNRITRKIAAKFFERLGHEIAAFNTVEALVAGLNTSTFQILFVDINEVETPNLIPTLMDLSQAANNTPIIIITENHTEENVTALKALGVTEVITKPIQLKHLERLVANLPIPSET